MNVAMNLYQRGHTMERSEISSNSDYLTTQSSLATKTSSVLSTYSSVCVVD